MLNGERLHSPPAQTPGEAVLSYSVKLYQCYKARKRKDRKIERKRRNYFHPPKHNYLQKTHKDNEPTIKWL